MWYAIFTIIMLRFGVHCWIFKKILCKYFINSVNIWSGNFYFNNYEGIHTRQLDQVIHNHPAHLLGEINRILWNCSIKLSLALTKVYKNCIGEKTGSLHGIWDIVWSGSYRFQTPWFGIPKFNRANAKTFFPIFDVLLMITR